MKKGEENVVPSAIINHYKVMYRYLLKTMFYFNAKIKRLLSIIYQKMNSNTDSKLINRLIGYILVTPSLISSFILVLRLFVDRKKLLLTGINGEEIMHDFVLGIPTYPGVPSSNTPFLIGLLALSGVYLLKANK
jgi:hypothetical protein